MRHLFCFIVSLLGITPLSHAALGTHPKRTFSRTHVFKKCLINCFIVSNQTYLNIHISPRFYINFELNVKAEMSLSNHFLWSLCNKSLVLLQPNSRSAQGNTICAY